MITVQSVVDEMTSALDAEGTDHYRFDLDFKPAITHAIGWVTSVIDSIMGEKKLSEEFFRDLSFAKVFQTNAYSRWVMDENNLGHKVWTIFAVHPNPGVVGNNTSILPLADAESRYRSDLSPTKMFNFATRLNAEEWAGGAYNPFIDGHVVGDNEPALSWAYINWSNYGGGYTNPEGGEELEVRPNMNNKFVAVRYARTHPDITVIGDNILFPEPVSELIVNSALMFLSRKQGDNTTMGAESEKELKSLISSYIK